MSTPAFKKYKIGGQDRFDHTIESIYELTENYAIYETDKSLLCFDEAEESSVYANKLSEISSKMAIIRIIKAESDRQLINSLMSEAWKECFKDKANNARDILDSLINKILVRGKLKYVGAAAVLTLLLIIAGWYFMYYYRYVLTMEKVKIVGLLVAGSFGGMISILIKLKEIYPDPNSNLLNVISGLSRILIAGSSAMIFYLAYKAHIILSIFQGGPENEIYYLFFCAFIFGFAERFIPEIANDVNKLVKIEKKNT